MNSRWLLACLALQACSLFGENGGGGGGGEVGGSFTFRKGFVFVRRDDGNVYAANEDGGYSPVKQLSSTGGARQPSLSRDGQRVVFARTVGTDTELDVVSSSGGTVSAVLASSNTERNFRHPVFSPDGTFIVFTYDTGGSSAVGVVNVDGTNFRRVAGGSTLSYASPTFTPDGGAILVATGNSGLKLDQVEQVDVATGAVTTVTNDLSLAVYSIANRIVVSPDGTLAAFDAKTSADARRIFVLNLSTRQVSQLTDYPGEASAVDSFPSWKGGEVAFSSTSGGNDNVYVRPSSAMKTSGGLTLPGAIEPWFGPN